MIAGPPFPRGNRYLQLRDQLGTLFDNADFAALYSHRGQPTYSPWRLALVTVMQYMENLSDRQAAEAVRARLDWKYALGLSLGDAGFDASVLCEFRGRLACAGAEDLLLGRTVALRKPVLSKLEGGSARIRRASWLPFAT